MQVNDKEFADKVTDMTKQLLKAKAEGRKQALKEVEELVESKDTMEALAHIEHERWNGWMKYLFTQGEFNKDGSFTIKKSSTEWWKHLTETQYKDLTEKSKESDRNEVRNTLSKLKQAIDQLRNKGV